MQVLEMSSKRGIVKSLEILRGEKGTQGAYYN